DFHVTGVQTCALPISGKLSYVRDARGKALWVYPGSYRAPQRGRDVRLSIDLEMQRIVTEELTRGVEEADAAGGRSIVLDPITGEIGRASCRGRGESSG